MKGLKLAEEFYLEEGRPRILACEAARTYGFAAGLVGEGSDCLGFDDEWSRDHDWGPGFCIWLTGEQFARYGSELQRLYEDLPLNYKGYHRMDTALAGQRVGVFEIETFYQRFLGRYYEPKSLEEWMILPESYLATAVNGKVFEDQTGRFSEIRQHLLNYYPEDVRLKKIAARLAVMAREGQYNFSRCIKRGNRVAAILAATKFAEAAISAYYLLNRKYMPYYKWAWYGLDRLSDGGVFKTAIEDLITAPSEDKIAVVVDNIIRELHGQCITDAQDDFLQIHAEQVMTCIQSASIRQRHILEG